MDESFHVLDPEGDVLLILQSPDEEFAAWSEAAEAEKCTLGKDSEMQGNEKWLTNGTFDEQNYNEPGEEPEPNPSNPKEKSPETQETSGQGGVRLQVSSKHLRLASPLFRRMFSCGLQEAVKLQSGECVEIRMETWDADVVLILMNAIHGKIRNVPRTVSLETLAKIAVLVDYYECHEVVELCSEKWIDHLERNAPRSYSRDLMLWLCISWVFKTAYGFQAATRVAMEQSRGSILSLGLPIPPRVLAQLNQRREEALGGMITSLHELLKSFRESPGPCSFECSSMLLGALTKGMHARNLLDPQPVAPFTGHNITETVDSISKIPSPRWYNEDPSRYNSRPHKYGLEQHIEPITKNFRYGMKGLHLSDID
ncbi:hypothetical protein PRK78_003324 [Emydomyces testavorans]|uniref:BTB domain-containing protein n=1 Tax=Emydomyces testavorans TaxID=2070801 RepID=A0AAF0DFZ8_9EURO|nr:hypothetical protein PRK78_003324 [Emydomyces testavorans]